MSKKSTVKFADQPCYVAPMLLRRTHELPAEAGWQYEVKWDGWRMQAIKCAGKVRLLSRNGSDCTTRFRSVADQVAKLRKRTVHLDGELVACDGTGRPCFQTLQAGALPPGWSFGYYAFDLLHDGKPLFNAPLGHRRERLQAMLDGSSLRFSPAVHGSPQAVVKLIREQRLEGVVAKRLDAIYRPGERSSAWLKMPLKQAGEFLIGGYRGYSRVTALLVGRRNERGAFVFCGKVKAGLSTQSSTLVDELGAFQTSCCPFFDLPKRVVDHFDEAVTAEEMPLFTWVKPGQTITVAFTEWTRAGWLRLAELPIAKTE